MSDEAKYDSEASSLIEQFPDDLDVSQDEVEEEISRLVDEYSLPVSEATLTIRNKYQDDYDGDEDFGNTGSAAEQRNIGSLSADEVSEDETKWITVEGKVTNLFELSEAQDSWIHQRGVIGDDSGDCLFTVPEDALDDKSIDFEEGSSYRLETIVFETFDGNIDLKVTSASEITEIDEEFTPPTADDTFRGRVVSVQDGSGLIQRCTVEEDGDTCGNALRSGRCGTHGDVEGEFDLRILATLDNGQDTKDVYFNREQTEAIVDMDLEEAIEKERENIQGSPVLDMIKQLLIGREYKVAGIDSGDYLTVSEFNWFNESVPNDEANRLLTEINEFEVKA